MARELMQARYDADTVEEVEQYANEKEVSRSEALRRLTRTGLEVEAGDGEIMDTRDMATANINETVRLAGGAMVLLAVLFLVAAEVGLL